MKIIFGLAIAAFAWAVMLGITYVLAAICIYLCQEWRYEMRKLKRELKQSIWDIEWQLKMRKGK